MMWSLGTTIYFIIYGKAGTDALAAMSIMQTLQMLAKIVSGGFCGASSIIIGNEIGKGDLDKVQRYCRKFHLSAFIVGVLSGIVVYCAYIALEIYKLPLGYIRFRSRKWLHLLYKDTEKKPVDMEKKKKPDPV